MSQGTDKLPLDLYDVARLRDLVVTQSEAIRDLKCIVGDTDTLSDNEQYYYGLKQRLELLDRYITQRRTLVS